MAVLRLIFIKGPFSALLLARWLHILLCNMLPGRVALIENATKFSLLNVLGYNIFSAKRFSCGVEKGYYSRFGQLYFVKHFMVIIFGV